MTSLDITRRQWLCGACGLGLGMTLGVAAEALPAGSVETGLDGPYPRNAGERWHD